MSLKNLIDEFERQLEMIEDESKEEQERKLKTITSKKLRTKKKDLKNTWNLKEA